jgi:hypothetical protein
VLARKTFITRAWMATGKKLYYAITRGLNFTDHEGRGVRFVHQAPAMAARLREHPSVREVAIVPFPHRRAGTGLYAFVEANAHEQELFDFLGDAKPEHLQVVAALPRNGNGDIRSEILELVAMNQIDLIGPLIRTENERAVAPALSWSGETYTIVSPFERLFKAYPEEARPGPIRGPRHSTLKTQ